MSGYSGNKRDGLGVGAHERGPATLPAGKRAGTRGGLPLLAGSRIDDLRNLSSPDFDSRKLIRLCEELNTAYNNGCYFAALPNGAACSSQFYTCSHVLSAMRLPEDQKAGALLPPDAGARFHRYGAMHPRVGSPYRDMP